MRNVLVVVPMGQGNKRVYQATSYSVSHLQWDGRLDTILMHSDPQAQKAHYYDLADKLNAAAEMVMLHGYDALFIIEYDMVVPEDALVKLASVDADVVYGLYCLRTTTTHQWLVARELDEDRVTWVSNVELAGSWGKVVESVGLGTGCTLIKREALKKLVFRAGRFAPDWYLALDAQDYGMKQAHHLGVACGHIMDDARVVWPDVTKPELFRIEDSGRIHTLSRNNSYRVLPGQALAIDSKKMLAKAGTVVRLSQEQAAILLRKGVVECA